MKLSNEENRLRELLELYNGNNINNNLEEFHTIIDTLIYVQEALAETKIKVRTWEMYSETLLHKLIFHGISIHNILSGIELKSKYYKQMNGKVIYDIASAKVILRALLESFLMYHYIYINPSDDDLKELRHNAWIYSALLKRQDFQATTNYAKNKKKQDIIALEKIKKRIQEQPSFNFLTSKQQQSLLEYGSGKLFKHWTDIIIETGFNKEHKIHSIYNHLSIYSHSEGLSMMQLQFKEDFSSKIKAQANLDIFHSKLFICMMINTLINKYSIAMERFKEMNWQTQFDINFYNTVARELH